MNYLKPIVITADPVEPVTKPVTKPVPPVPPVLPVTPVTPVAPATRVKRVKRFHYAKPKPPAPPVPPTPEPKPERSIEVRRAHREAMARYRARDKRKKRQMDEMIAADIAAGGTGILPPLPNSKEAIELRDIGKASSKKPMKLGKASDFAGKPETTYREDVTWVSHNIAIRGVRAVHAPSGRAWWLLVNARRDPKILADLLKSVMRDDKPDEEEAAIKRQTRFLLSEIQAALARVNPL